MEKIKEPEFSYKYYEAILNSIKKNFNYFLFKEAPTILKQKLQKTIIFLRHDIDLDLDKALALAEIENRYGMLSCYMIMTQCPFYSIKEANTKTIIKELISMGHEIGLHFDYSYSSLELLNQDSEQLINTECQVLEEITGQRVYSISFHRPFKKILQGPFWVAGRVNAYSSELMNWYLSDSRGIWREGEPLQFLENPTKPVLQFLVHPIWWGKEHQLPEDILQSFFEEKTKNLSQTQIDKFDRDLSKHLSIRRKKYLEGKI